MQLRSLLMATSLAMAVSGCSHLQIWESPEYVEPANPAYQRLETRLDALYAMACQGGSKPSARPYIINGRRVLLRVPRSNDCQKAIPYAVCPALPEIPAPERCTRVD